jgi:hypothetical protein
MAAEYEKYKGRLRVNNQQAETLADRLHTLKSRSSSFH